MPKDKDTVDLVPVLESKGVAEISAPKDFSLTEILKTIHPDHDYGLNEAGKKLLDNFVRLSSMVDTTAIMTCRGADSCVLAQCGECPLYEADAVLPEGKLCPIEVSQYGIKLTNMMAGLRSGDPDEFVSRHEYEILQRLVGMEIQLSRVQKEISVNPEAVVKSVVGVDADGRPIMQLIPNPAYQTLKSIRQSISTQQKHLQQVISSRQKVVRVRIGNKTVQEERERLTKVLETDGSTSALLQLHKQKKNEREEVINRRLDNMSGGDE